MIRTSSTSMISHYQRSSIQNQEQRSNDQAKRCGNLSCENPSLEFTLGRPDWHEKWLSWSIWIFIYIGFFIFLFHLSLSIYTQKHVCSIYLCDDEILSVKEGEHVESQAAQECWFLHREREYHYQNEEIWRFLFSSSIDDLIIKWMINVWVFVFGFSGF